jgi:toxin ParE1/3/4
VKIIWSPLAVDRIAEIAAWIAEDRPKAAEGVVENLFAAVERLTQFPESGRPVPEIDQPEIREIIEKPYRIIYRTGADSVEILTIRHSRQELEEEDLAQ